MIGMTFKRLLNFLFFGNLIYQSVFEHESDLFIYYNRTNFISFYFPFLLSGSTMLKANDDDDNGDRDFVRLRLKITRLS